MPPVPAINAKTGVMQQSDEANAVSMLEKVAELSSFIFLKLEVEKLPPSNQHSIGDLRDVTEKWTDDCQRLAFEGVKNRLPRFACLHDASVFEFA